MRRPISAIFVLMLGCTASSPKAVEPPALVFPVKPPIQEDPTKCIPPGPKPEAVADFGLRRPVDASYYTISEYGYREMWKYMSEVYSWMDAAEACLKPNSL